MSAEHDDQDTFQVTLNNKTYTISIAETNITDTKFKVEYNGHYLCTLVMNQEGNWEAEEKKLSEELTDKIGRAIEEHDVA